ncbi:MAG: OB-fold nucleic acid binding domain-containing protein [Candidatus Nanoarchaeia archaeon]|jgi:RecJ-like exonuclease
MPEDVSEKRKRRTAVEKKIKSLSNEDGRVTVIGTVLSVDTQSLVFTIEDPSGQLTIIAPTEDLVKDVAPGKIIRVIGIVLPYEGGVELRAELVQDFSGLSKELFPVLHELMS